MLFVWPDIRNWDIALLQLIDVICTVIITWNSHTSFDDTRSKNYPVLRMIYFSFIWPWIFSSCAPLVAEIRTIFPSLIAWLAFYPLAFEQMQMILPTKVSSLNSNHRQRMHQMMEPSILSSDSKQLWAVMVEEMHRLLGINEVRWQCSPINPDDYLPIQRRLVPSNIDLTQAKVFTLSGLCKASMNFQDNQVSFDHR